MENELVETSLMHGQEERVLIRPVGSIRDISLVPCILRTFADYFKRGHYFFVLDLTNMDLLTPALIALLFEVTARARRKGGDVEIANLNEFSRKSLSHFNPFDYLSIGDDVKLPAEQNIRAESVTQEAAVAPRTLSNWPEKDIRPNQSVFKETQIPSKAESIYKACDFVTSIAAQTGMSSLDLGKLKIAVYEGCLNAIEHAYRSNPNHSITVRVESNESTFTVTVIDTGEGFADTDEALYDVVEAASERQTGGMGLHIIRKAMDRVNYKSDPLKGNHLIMTKFIGPKDSEKVLKLDIHPNR